MYDLVIRGGRVIDPGNNVDQVATTRGKRTRKKEKL